MNAGCSLHIHGTSDYWGPFYSLDSAIGLAMATGNLGDRLTAYASKTNTYLTRDGGLSWIEAAKGSHIYEFGDHGGVILMARDNVPTQTLSYSWDQGECILWIPNRTTESHLLAFTHSWPLELLAPIVIYMMTSFIFLG